MEKEPLMPERERASVARGQRAMIDGVLKNKPIARRTAERVLDQLERSGVCTPREKEVNDFFRRVLEVMEVGDEDPEAAWAELESLEDEVEAD